MVLALTILTLIIAALALFLQYLALPEHAHRKVSTGLKWLMGSAWRVIPYALVIGVCLMSATGIVLFAFGDKPIRRLEVTLLFGHFINLGLYGHILLSGRLSKLNKKSGATTEPAI